MYDIIIIGAGTAGMTAALYALRAGSSVLLIESETIGGQISFTPKVENYPGIMQISGAEFSSNLFDQIERLGATYEIATVSKIERIKAESVSANKSEKNNTVIVNGDNLSNSKQQYFKVTADGKAYYAKSVIIASGVKPRKLGITREDELFGEGICYCAVCDGAFYKGKNVAVCGGGNSALTDALFLSAYCSHVTLIHRKDTFSAEKTLVDRLLSKTNVEILYNTTVTELIGSPALTAVRVFSPCNSLKQNSDNINSNNYENAYQHQDTPRKNISEHQNIPYESISQNQNTPCDNISQNQNAPCDNISQNQNIPCESISQNQNTPCDNISQNQNAPCESMFENQNSLCKNQNERIINIEALFVAVGHCPDNSAFSDVAKLDKNGFIIAGDNCLTSAEGIFAAGDCRTKQLRQLTTAVADGATAGLAASQYADSIK